MGGMKDERVWSFSRLTSYETCHHSFYRKYILGESDKQNDWGACNGFAHDILEATLKGELPYEEAADVFWSGAHEYTFPTMRPDYARKHTSAIYNFFKQWRGIQGEIIGVERSFVIDIGGEKLRGFIDLETRDEEGIKTIDWKGSAISGFQGKKLKEKERQLQLYSISAEEHWGEPVSKAFFYLLKYNKAIEVDLSPKAIQEARDWMLRLIEEIDNDTTWEAKPSYFWCSNICGSVGCEFNRNYKPNK